MIVASDTPDALKRQVAGDLIELVLANEEQVATAAAQLGKLSASGSGTADVNGLVVSMRIPDAGTELPGLLRSLDSAGVALTAIEVRRPTLDDVFLTMTGRSLREDA